MKKNEVVSSNWSRQKLDDKRKLDQKLEKLEKSIENAFANNDYNNLKNVINECGQIKSKSNIGDGTEESQPAQ